MQDKHTMYLFIYSVVCPGLHKKIGFWYRRYVQRLSFPLKMDQPFHHHPLKLIKFWYRRYRLLAALGVSSIKEA